MYANQSLIYINNQPVGEDSPVYIIAEIGVNHNGDFETCKRLIDAAAKSGADIIKFQSFTAENVVTRNAKKANYQKISTQSNFMSEKLAEETLRHR